MLDSFLGGTVPHEAQVAVAGTHRINGARVRRRAGAVNVQLLSVGKPVGVPAVIELDNLDAEHVAVEGVRASPVRDRDYDVIELRARHTLFSSSCA